MSFLKCHYRLENVRVPGTFHVIAFSCTAVLLSAVAPIGPRSGQQWGWLAPALELVTAFQWSEMRSKTNPPPPAVHSAYSSELGWLARACWLAFP